MQLSSRQLELNSCQLLKTDDEDDDDDDRFGWCKSADRFSLSICLAVLQEVVLTELLSTSLRRDVYTHTVVNVAALDSLK